MATQGYAQIPPVHLIRDELVKEFPEIDPDYLTQVVRDQIFFIRKNISEYTQAETVQKVLLTRCIKMVNQSISGSLNPVINGTGIVLHTGLGRAPLSADLLNDLLPAWTGYLQLELDMETGERGDRNSHNVDLLRFLTGAESGIVVNNNASAVLLALTALAKGGEAVVSRSQLVEIGGSFRIPEVMEQSGATMIEVGATNRTHLSDYVKAISPRTKAFFLAHRSNYRILGFTSQPSLKELTDEAHRRHLPVIYDLGSGLLRDMKAQHITDESIVRQVIAAGVDVISFSGDKLLGGPQAGIIIGKERFIKVLRHHPLMRAVRCDKLILSLIQKTLTQYILNNGKILSHQLLARTREELSEMSKRILHGIHEEYQRFIHIEETSTEAGSGAAPILQIPSLALVFAIQLPVETLARIFRTNGIPPVIGYIHQGRYFIDLRAIIDKDVSPLIRRINEVIKELI